MTKQILFIDAVCPDAYDANSLKEGGLGGTESTVIRIAEALSQLQEFDVAVLQHNKAVASKPNKVLYDSLLKIDSYRKVHAVVCIRSHFMMPFLRDKFPDATLVLWLHDLMDNNSDFAISAPILQDVDVKVLGVSDFHKSNIIDCIKSRTDPLKSPVVDYIYNPVDDSYVPDDTPRNENKLVFLSSPHKGLKQVLGMFKFVNRTYPKYKLYIANPGYYDLNLEEQPNVEVLGKLPHDEVMRHLRESAFLFYPNTDYRTRETFGLVLAEANAVGTPVIAHHHGAAPEVIDDKKQVFDCMQIKNIVDTITYHNVNKPKIALNQKFRLSEVIKKWLILLK